MQAAVHGLGELEARLEQSTQVLNSAGVQADLPVNVWENRVDVMTPEPEALRAVLGAAKATLPDAGPEARRRP